MPQDQEQKGSGAVREIVLPLAVVIGLIANAWWGGVGWGRVSNQLKGLSDQIITMNSRLDHGESDMAELQRWRISVDKDNAERDQRFKLFRMYTKGRIARLPYRSVDDGE